MQLREYFIICLWLSAEAAPNILLYFWIYWSQNMMLLLHVMLNDLKYMYTYFVHTNDVVHECPALVRTIARYKKYAADYWETNVDPDHIDGLVQDCSISSALAMEILQFCNKPSIYCLPTYTSFWWERMDMVLF